MIGEFGSLEFSRGEFGFGFRDLDKSPDTFYPTTTGEIMQKIYSTGNMVTK